jgi:hypothetical protein
MPFINLTNVSIQAKQDIKSRTYYLITDEDTGQTYFCFSGAMKEG